VEGEAAGVGNTDVGIRKCIDTVGAFELQLIFGLLFRTPLPYVFNGMRALKTDNQTNSL
jgi:ABC-type nitrate/sulfonate/bicarbonate transport system permease component